MKKLSKTRKKWIERTVSNNRSYKAYLYNRFFLFLILFLMQVVGYVWLIYLFTYHSRIGLAVEVSVAVLELLVILYLINKNDRPSVKLNWILLILLVPIVGVPMYLLYGEGRPTRLMNRKIVEAKEENNARWKELYGDTKLPDVHTREDAVGWYLAKCADYPAYHDGEITYYSCGEEMFPAMKEALSGAKRYILVEYFIISHGKMWKEILALLLEKASQGVQVRILYDDFGCMMTLPPRYETYLESLHENIRCMTFNDVVPIFKVKMNNRDHRKMLVVDGKVAFTGGINLADEYINERRRFGYWKDSGIKITGDGVAPFVKMFFYLWNAFYSQKEDIGKYLLPKSEKDGGRYALTEKKPCIQPYDDSPFDRVSVGETVYLDIINRAVNYVYIFTPYLVLDDSLRSALCLAAMRGVDVRIVTPAIPDKKMIFRLTRANYEILLKAGVKIYEYTPGFIHAKSIVCDDECAVVGTINFDYRSLYLHFENAVYFSGCEAVGTVKKDCDETFALSRQRTLENSKKNVFGHLIDSLLRVFETLF